MNLPCLRFFLTLKYYYPLPLCSPHYMKKTLLIQSRCFDILKWQMIVLDIKVSLICITQLGLTQRPPIPQAHPARGGWPARMDAMLSQLRRPRDLSSHPCRHFLKPAISELSEGVLNSTEPYGTCIKAGFFLSCSNLFSFILNSLVCK